MSEIIETIIRQLSCQGLDRLALVCMGFRLFVKIDDNTLRLHFKIGKGAVNIDIHYNESLDVYEVKAHKINSKTLEVKTTEYRDIYFDQFAELFSEILKVGE